MGVSLVALRVESRLPERPSLSFARCISSTTAAQIDGIPRSCLNETSLEIHYIHWQTDTHHLASLTALDRHAQLQASNRQHLYHHRINLISFLLEPLCWVYYRSYLTTLVLEPRGG